MNPFTTEGILLQSTSKLAGAAAGVALPSVGSLIALFCPQHSWLHTWQALFSPVERGRTTPQSRGEEAVSKAAQYRGWSSTLGCPRWNVAQLGSHTTCNISTTGIPFAVGHAVSLTVWKTPGKHFWCLSPLRWKVMITHLSPCLSSGVTIPFIQSGFPKPSRAWQDTIQLRLVGFLHPQTPSISHMQDLPEQVVV